MITDLIKKGAGFVLRPSHSRTLGLVLMLILVAAVSLTVYVAQQQQELRQRAEGIPCGGIICDPGQYCNSSGSDEFCADIPATPTLTPTPTPVKVTNCGDLLCIGDQKCLIEQPQPGEGTIATYSCVAPTPTPTPATSAKKKVKESCTPTLAECESGSECVDYDELGYSICTSLPVSPTSIPTNTPTPAPVATIWIENPQANWDADGVIRRQVTEDAAKTFYLGGWSQVTGPLTPDIVAADRPLGTKSRFGTNIDSSGTSTTVYPSATISYITPTLAPTTICTTNADCPAPPSCYSGAQKNCLNGGTANATCFYTSNSGTCQITSQANTCASVCVATPTPTPTLAPAAVVSLKDKGDANGDKLINILDYNIWRDEFLGNVQTKTADFDGDGQITILDFNIWYQFRGT